MTRVIVTGSRVWPSREAICYVLKQHDPELVVHGNARGADQFAHDWAIANERQVHVFPGKWKTLAGGRMYNPAAGHIRNGVMLDAYPSTLVLAFPYGLAKGTRDCIAQALERWHEVRVYDLKGELVDHLKPDEAEAVRSVDD
jgi:hypothetical protein